MSATRRKLTTIFSADVQGYSRLMETDEEGTLATLKTYRDAMGGLIEAHGGRVVNTWGDGLIAEFPSVVEAVRAAVDVQGELAERNAGRSDASRMLFRIGINLGDVIAEGDDIYGDGVNIAARLQSSAAPGGIVISSTVYEQVRNKVAVGFEFLGQLSVKNIDEAVPSYAVRLGGAGASEARAAPPAPAPFGRPAANAPAARGILSNRPMAGLALAGAVLVAINVITWDGVFWAGWPVLILALIGGLAWARRTRRLPPSIASALVVALFIVAINLSTWSGSFWAIWPLLGIGVAVAIRFLVGGRTGNRPA